MPANGAARVRFLFHCWLLLIAAAALCDEAAAQGSACGKLDPSQVDPIPDAAVRSPGANFVTLDWLPPDFDSMYYYIVSCLTCPTKQANTTDETYTFFDLTAATDYSFTIQAGRWNCRLSTPFYLSGKTYLSAIPGPVHISDVTETSFRANWAASPDAGVQYEVNGALTVQSTSYMFSGQESGARVEVAVRPVKTGFYKGFRIFGTAFTKLFAIDAYYVKVSASETAISVSWRPSITSDVFYQLTCTRVSSGDVTNVTSSSPSATCSSLQSGEAYRLSVAVKKEGGFDDVVTQLPNHQLTKLFAIDANTALFIVRETSIELSWGASATEGVKYQVNCRRVSTGHTVVMPESTSLAATFASLQSGEAYKLSVAVKKPGLEEAVTWLPTQLTKLFAVDVSSSRFIVNETAISVSWRASSTAGVSYQLTCIQVGSGDVTDVASSSPSATCGFLQSGEAYNLSVSVKKEGGFDEAVTWLPTQLTKNRGRCPSEDWLQFSGFCYLLVKGSNGRTLTEAMLDCQRRESSGHLLWVTSQAEMDWVTDYSARNWRLREDYRAQCKNCRFQGDAAWTGLYRDEADGGKFKWFRDNSAVNVSVNWLIGPSQPPMNFGYLLDDSRELLWRTYQPEARQFHFCKAPMRGQHQSPRSDATVEAALENSAKATFGCPSPAWTLLYQGHSNQLCFLRTYRGSFRWALKECRRWAPNSEMLPIRTLWRQLDRPVPYYHICRLGSSRVKSAIRLEMRRTAGQAMHLGASCLHCQDGLLLSSLLSGLLLQLMRLLPAG